MDLPFILKLRAEGWFQHQIAAVFGCNQGRISELLSGKGKPRKPR